MWLGYSEHSMVIAGGTEKRRKGQTDSVSSSSLSSTQLLLSLPLQRRKEQDVFQSPFGSGEGHVSARGKSGI